MLADFDMSSVRKFDLALFMELNEEYRGKPLVPAPPAQDPRSRTERALSRIRTLQRRVDLKNCRMLEVGCGLGDFSHAAADSLDCDVVGVDIIEYDDWQQLEHPRLTLLKRDISAEPIDDLGQFDRIVSFSVWEHMRHPYSALKAARSLISDTGRVFISANLYRGPKASHRYREVFFPWPHLLFGDDVFQEFYRRQNIRRTAAWVNRLTYAEYHHYFRLLGFEVELEWLSKTPIDEAFYRRFEYVLSRYPRFDLEIDFINVVLKPASDVPQPPPSPLAGLSEA